MALRGVCKLVTLTAVEFTPKYTQRLESGQQLADYFWGSLSLRGVLRACSS